MTVSLDLGCGVAPKNPFKCDSVLGIDIANETQSPLVIAADLNIEGIPLDSDTVDVVTAFDFIEHVPRLLYIPQRINPFIQLMNEIDRVLRPGGLFFQSTPCYPHAAAFQDPTHVNIITTKTFVNYFSSADGHRCLGRMYGYVGNLMLLSQYIYRESHLRCTMQKGAAEGLEASSSFHSERILATYKDIIYGCK